MTRTLLTSSLAGLPIWASVACCALVCGAQGAHAQGVTVQAADQPAQELTQQELRALEEALGEDVAQREEVAPPAPASAGARAIQQMNPDLSLILDVAAAGFRGQPRQLGAHDPSRTGFNLQQLELSASSSVDPYFTFEANIVFAQFGVEVEEAFARTSALPWNLQARAGQFLTPFGRLNPTHPHSWMMLDQALVNAKFFGAEGSRGLGAQAGWLAPLPWFLELSAAVTMADGACCARSFWGAQSPGVSRPRDLLLTTRLEQFFALTDALSLLAGASAQFGPNPTGARNRTEIYGGDLYLRFRPLQNNPNRRALSVQVEAMQRRRQVPGDVLVDQGFYAHILAELSALYEVGARYERVSGMPDDPLDPEWTGARQRLSLQGTYRPSHFSRLRLQGMWDRVAWDDVDTFGLMLGLEVLVGPHGAHDF